MLSNIEMIEMVVNGDGESDKKRDRWGKTEGIRMKKKKVPGVKNLNFKPYIKPKNAIMCLNELIPGLTFAVEQEGGISQPFCVSVEVDGQKFRGYGSSKQLAKQAASEAALISFVRPPPASKTVIGEDKTPWTTLAAFGIYKLFNDWREGRIGVCTNSNIFACALPPDTADIQPLLGRAINALTKSQGCGDTGTIESFNELLSKHLEEREAPSVSLGGRGIGGSIRTTVTPTASRAPIAPVAPVPRAPPAVPPVPPPPAVPAAVRTPPAAPAPPPATKVSSGVSTTGDGSSNIAVKGNANVPNPAKQIPDNAAEMHPVTVLHQMHPGLTYTNEKITKDNKPYVIISASINDEKFSGEGPNMKKAKLELAKKAIKCLYGIQSTFTL
ncbi:uncharacterized protein LOC143022157 isoform X3 [Oratosquilla oratoria]|uniref:uncharacterized protein LOC143022157 isoform X3 n=1 Tax=Oratosquilla oratoria TaxID=337810 RepID=UPI003F76E909